MQPDTQSDKQTPATSYSLGWSAGDDGQEPLTRLIESMRPDLLRFAHWLARDRSVAEDIVQDAMLRAWRSRKDLREPAAVRCWLLTIVRREHARLYERKRLELVCLEDGIEHEGVSDPHGPDSELQTLRSAILRLPLEYREPLIMQVVVGSSTAEIARELSLSSSAVLTRLFRARNKLRAMFSLSSAPKTSVSAGL
jgi:RNA polymerase sigma-70 factor (ECF subfamily)